MPCSPEDPLGVWLSAAATQTAAAAIWAERLQAPVLIEATPCPPTGLPPSPLDTAVGWLRGQAMGFVEVPCALVADRLSDLVGPPGRSPRSLQRGLPAPLSPAEEGLLAWLILGWFGAWPEPKPALAWLAGPLSPSPSLPELDASVLWRVQIDDAPPGVVRWHIGSAGASASANPLTCVEVHAHLDPRITPERLDAARPGEGLLLDPRVGPLTLTLPDGSRWRACVEEDALKVLDQVSQAPHRAQGLSLALSPLRLSTASISALKAARALRLERPVSGAVRSLGHGALVSSVGGSNVLVVLGAA